jgi:S1-C subfamily serine protease
VDQGTEPTFQPRAVARAVAAIIALLATGLAGFLVANQVALVSPTRTAPFPIPAASAPTPSPPLLTDLGRNDLASVVTVEAELESGTAESLGTGWVFDNLGDVVTNAHVVNGDNTLRVTDRAGNTYVARLVQSSESSDLALLRVTGTLDGSPLPVDARSLSAVPIPVITLASSRATGHTDMTPETLIGLDDNVPLQGTGIEAGRALPQEYDDMLHLQGTRIYEGNSGGPVLDASGRVVGIVTLASPSSADAYAIPISRVLSTLRQWVAAG